MAMVVGPTLLCNASSSSSPASAPLPRTALSYSPSTPTAAARSHSRVPATRASHSQRSGRPLPNNFLGADLRQCRASAAAVAASAAVADAVDLRREGRGGRKLVVEAAKRKSSARNLVLSSTLIAEAGKEEQVAKLCESVLKLAEEKKTSHPESGIVHFECSTDAYDKNVVHFWERYDSFLSMNDFHASPEYTKFLEEVRPMLTSPVLLAAYEYKDGQIGCMLNPIGPKGEGGLDDATGQGGSGGGASYKQTSQSLQQGIGERDAWGIEQALDISKTRNAAKDAASAIAEGLRSIFGGNKNKK